MAEYTLPYQTGLRHLLLCWEALWMIHGGVPTWNFCLNSRVNEARLSVSMPFHLFCIGIADRFRTEYPRVPPKAMRSIIQLDTNALLAQIHTQRAAQITEGNDIATINRNSEVIDAPLVRAFNFLRELLSGQTAGLLIHHRVRALVSHLSA